MESCRKPPKSKGVDEKVLPKKHQYEKTSQTSRLDKSQVPNDDIELPYTHRPICKGDVPWLEKVKQVIDLTRKSEDEVVMALHDCDGDLDRAVNDLLEGICPEWMVKKKKSRQSQIVKLHPPSDVSSDCFNLKGKNTLQQNPNVRSSLISRGWRRRENKENEENLEGSRKQINYGCKRGRGVGSRSGRGGRGGGRSSFRTFVNRAELLGNSHLQRLAHPIDTWTGHEGRTDIPKPPTSESWNIPDSTEEWENEEYTGSLADTKVFTPSSVTNGDQDLSDRDLEKQISSTRAAGLADETIHDMQKYSRQRPRIPPPSRIPSTAVEMPKDSLNNTMGLLDVQFGALDFGSDGSLNEGKVQNESDSPSLRRIESAIVTTQQTEVLPKPTESIQCPKQVFNPTTSVEPPADDSLTQTEQSLDTSRGFGGQNSSIQIAAKEKDDVDPGAALSPPFKPTIALKSSTQTFGTPGQGSSYTYPCPDPNQTTFTCPSTTSSDSNSFSGIVSVTQSGFNSLYNQSCSNDFNQTTVPLKSPKTYDQSAAISSAYKSSSTASNIAAQQYESNSPSNMMSTNHSYMSTTYQKACVYQSTPQTFGSPSSSFSSSTNQGCNSYPNAVHSVYSSTYNYSNDDHIRVRDTKIGGSKEIQFKCGTTAALTSLAVTATCSLGLTSSTVDTTQTKTTSIASTRALVSNPTSNSINSSANGSGSGSTGNITPILGHQYIMGQSVPYATFQQPHLYSYEDLQMIQQRLPHMPTTGYYDTTMGYQTTGSSANLGTSRNEPLPAVQGVQNVPSVPGQYNTISDTRFTRSDNETSPASSSMSQSAAQHQQPLMNAIPPGYAYFYGGGLMPASGFQYSTPAIYPQIPSASNAGTTSGVYSAKSGSYSSGYTSSASYDSLTRSGSPGDFKNNGGFTNTQSKGNCASTGNTSSSISSSEIAQASYNKGHISLNKTFEKQSFHSATPPPFSLNSNQNANVISGYGTAHLFIPTVPHQLHQPIHQEISNNSSQRTAVNTQSKTQAKSGYGPSYWAGGN